jgi:hypothetical protein
MQSPQVPGVYVLDSIPVFEVPLVIERGYRGGTEQKLTVTFRRRVACVCGFSGCARCEAVGWVLRTASADIQIPAGIDLGMRLLLPGQGDAMDTVSPGDLMVEIVEEGERAVTLRAEQHAREDEWEAAFFETRDERRRGRRSSGRLLLAVLLVGTAVGAVAVMVHYRKGEIGKRCEDNGDCRSDRCLVVQRSLTVGDAVAEGEKLLPGHSLLAPVTEQRLCSETCTRETDCPAGMTCGTAVATTVLAANVVHDTERACLPR